MPDIRAKSVLLYLILISFSGLSLALLVLLVLAAYPNNPFTFEYFTFSAYFFNRRPYLHDHASPPY